MDFAAKWFSNASGSRGQDNAFERETPCSPFIPPLSSPFDDDYCAINLDPDAPSSGRQSPNGSSNHERTVESDEDRPVSPSNSVDSDSSSTRFGPRRNDSQRRRRTPSTALQLHQSVQDRTTVGSDVLHVAVGEIRSEVAAALERQRQQSSDDMTRMLSAINSQAIQDEAKRGDLIKALCQFLMDQMEANEGNLKVDLSNRLMEGVRSVVLEQTGGVPLSRVADDGRKAQELIVKLHQEGRLQRQSIIELRHSLEGAQQRLRSKEEEAQRFASEIANLQSRMLSREQQVEANMSQILGAMRNIVAEQTDLAMTRIQSTIISQNSTEPQFQEERSMILQMQEQISGMNTRLQDSEDEVRRLTDELAAMRSREEVRDRERQSDMEGLWETANELASARMEESLKEIREEIDEVKTDIEADLERETNMRRQLHQDVEYLKSKEETRSQQEGNETIQAPQASASSTSRMSYTTREDAGRRLADLANQEREKRERETEEALQQHIENSELELRATVACATEEESEDPAWQAGRRREFSELQQLRRGYVDSSSSSWQEPTVALAMYQSRAAAFDRTHLGGISSSEDVSFDTIPWPVLKDHSQLTVDDVSWSSVELFFATMMSIMSKEDFLTLVKGTQTRFHLDRWLSRGVLLRVRDDVERMCVKHASNLVSQAATQILQQSRS